MYLEDNRRTPGSWHLWPDMDVHSFLLLTVWACLQARNTSKRLPCLHWNPNRRPFLAGGRALLTIRALTVPHRFTSRRLHARRMRLSGTLLLLGIATRCNGLAKAIVSNRCSFPVYLKSVQLNASILQTLFPGEHYSETYRYVSAFNPATGTLSSVGVSIKITTNEAVGQCSDEPTRNATFDSSAVTQFEYTYEPASLPDLYYDLSDINDAMPRQFCGYGIKIEPWSVDCDTIACKPDCSRPCGVAYNNPAENATHACHSSVSLNLILCSGV